MSRPRRTTTSTVHSAFADDIPRPRRRGTDTSRRSSSSRYSEAYSDAHSRASRLDEDDVLESDEYAEHGQEEETWQRPAGATRIRKKKDEPMSPILVVFYVTALYLIFQLLTRSDDLEILSHLPPTSSLLAPSHLSLGGSNLHSDMQHHYPGGGLPYPMPPIPPPMPNTPAERSTSLWRIIGGLALYPFYLLITLLAIPLPMLLNLLHVVLAVVLTVLYPLTSTGTLIFRTFVLAPLGVVRSVINTFWPIIAFVGGVILIGCVMGLIGGWMGRLGLEWVDRRMRRGPARKGNAGKIARSVRGVRSERRARSERDQPSGEERSSREDRSARRAVPEIAERFRRSDTVHRSEIQPRSNMDRSSRHHSSRTPEDSPSDSGTAHELVTPPRGHGGHNTHSRRSGNDKGKRRADAVEDEDYGHAGYDDAWRGAGRATAREPHVTGTRKRTHMLEAR